MKALFGSIPSPGPTILRIALGAIMLAHGVGKIHPFGPFPGYGFEATVATFHDKLGVPLPLAYAGTLAEGVGGLLLVLGLATRLAGLLVAGQMAVAAVLGGHLSNGFFNNWFGKTITDPDGVVKPAGEGWEMHLALVAMGLALVFLGGGKLSLDAKIAGGGGGGGGGA